MALLNLGILAHVDAGKTSLTERLLHDAGVIDEIGSVDAGSTQTDSLALERQRGITIKSAVVSFAIGGVTVNLIDTPGHPDFIAEVERVLSVLDGAVLVVSAVEGVQAQTRVLMRALRRLGLPTLIFVNKIDRTGADPDRVLAEIAAKLTPSVVPMTAARDVGTRAVATVPDPALPTRLLSQLSDIGRRAAGRVRRGRVRPVRTVAVVPGRADPAGPGAPGVLRLGDHRRRRGRADRGDRDAAAAGGRRPGRPAVRHGVQGRARPGRREDRVRADVLRDAARARPAGRRPGKVTGIGVFDRGGVEARPSVQAGQIGKLWGLRRRADRRPGRRRAHAARPSTSRRRRWRRSWSRRRAEPRPRCRPRSASSPSRTR